MKKINYNKILKNLEWERDVKSWDFDNIIPDSVDKLSIEYFKTNIILYGNNPKMKIDELKNCSESIQRRIIGIINSQKQNSKIDIIQKIKSKTDIVINIPANSKMTVDFVNNIFQFWSNIYFIIGVNSQVTILDKHKLNKSKFGAGSVMTILGKNTEVNYGIDTDGQFNYHMNYNFTCAESSIARVFVRNNIKAKHHYHSININHSKNNSHGEIIWLLDAQKDSKSVFYLANNHYGQNTTADMMVKVLSRDKSQTKIDGWINIGKKGINTDSYLSEDVLMLSDNSSVKAEPNLEIINNEVQASHGATLGSMDEKQLLYLQSRGLSKLEAENIITNGFMKAGLDRLKDDFLLNYFQDFIIIQ